MGTPVRVLVLGYNAWDVSLPVARMPRQDQKCEVAAIRFGGGGPGATAAIALSRLGARVKLVTVMGDDLPAAWQRHELLAAGVELGDCPTVPNSETPKAVILVQPVSGERTIFWSRGALPRLDPATVDRDWLDDQDLFYTDGHETAAAVVLAREASRRSLPVVMDAGSVRPGSAALVAEVTDAISSAGFAPQLTKCQDLPGALRALRRLGPQRVGMTFGEKGALALVNDRIRHVAAFEVAAVDTTGAGDAFHAGYAWARADGRGFLDCLEFGSAVAALKCTAWGGRQGLPDLAAVETMLRTGSRRPVPLDFAGLLA